MTNKGHQAIGDYITEIQKIVSCVAKDVCFPYSNHRGNLSLGWAKGPLQLKCSEGEQLWLDVTQELTKPSPNEDKISTLAYIYSILDSEKQPLIGFHYHPDDNDESITYPHIHAYATEDARFKRLNLHRRHIPSGRVPLEDVVRWLIAELRVNPLRDSWDTDLIETRQKFMASQSWYYQRSK